MGNFEVSFNSPQCGWMSVGFKSGPLEFHTTTANTPYNNVLPELLDTLREALERPDFLKILRWNRKPEEFDFVFNKKDGKLALEILQYPSEAREENDKETVFAYRGDDKEIVKAFYETFQRLYEDRDTDEFEANWKQSFPFKEFERLSSSLG